MKMVLAVCLSLVISRANAQAVECPTFYPWQDTPIAEVPYQHKGKGFIAKAELSGAGMYTGELNGRGELMGDRRNVKGGMDVHFNFPLPESRWLVCSYGNAGDITWWEQLETKARQCKLEIREKGRDPMRATLTCK